MRASYLTWIDGDITNPGTTSSIFTISCIVIIRVTISNAKHPRTNIARSTNAFIIRMIPCSNFLYYLVFLSNRLYHLTIFTHMST